jgi:hypothetical protein
MFDARACGHSQARVFFNPVEVSATTAVLEQARGVLAERFGIEIETADEILTKVARTQQRNVTELAEDVVRSCTDGSMPLPRRLY